MRDRLAAFRNRLGVPAAGAAVVTADGVLDSAVVGVRRRDGDTPAAIDDRWHIGSCGKSITAVLYARLVELGRAEWGVPVRHLFPDLASGADSGWAESTVDDLLHCRSGMRPNLPFRTMRRAWLDDRPLGEQRTAAAQLAMAGPPRRRGTLRYGNLGYVVVGAAIDRLTGMPFEAALRTHVLDPLGMRSAAYGAPPGIWGHRPRFRLGSFVVGRGAPADPSDPRSDNPAVLSPAGRLHLTLADWARLQRIFLNKGEPLLEPRSVEHLLRMPAADASRVAMGWASAVRLEGAALGMQGSNTMWSATAIIGTDFDRTAMVVVNDGRSRVLMQSARLAAALLLS